MSAWARGTKVFLSCKGRVPEAWIMWLGEFYSSPRQAEMLNPTGFNGIHCKESEFK